MSTLPILMSAPMVRAILDGRKTQTRRIVKGAWHEPGGYLQSEPEGDDGEWWFACSKVPASFFTRCPFGVAGDALWVKETFCAPGAFGVHGRKLYAANPEDDSKRPRDEIGKPHKWTPSIYMPRAASRITLEIVSVRVERLHDITEADAIAEGCVAEHSTGTFSICTSRCSYEITEDHVHGIPKVGERDAMGGTVLAVAHRPSVLLWSAREVYARLWDKLNGAGSWSANPWCWRIQFIKAAT